MQQGTAWFCKTLIRADLTRTLCSLSLADTLAHYKGPPPFTHQAHTCTSVTAAPAALHTSAGSTVAPPGLHGSLPGPPRGGGCPSAAHAAASCTPLVNSPPAAPQHPSGSPAGSAALPSAASCILLIDCPPGAPQHSPGAHSPSAALPSAASCTPPVDSPPAAPQHPPGTPAAVSALPSAASPGPQPGADDAAAGAAQWRCGTAWPQGEASDASTLGTRLEARELPQSASACEAGACELPAGPDIGSHRAAVAAGVSAAGLGACALAGAGAAKQASALRCAASWPSDDEGVRALGLLHRASVEQHASRILAS